MMYGSGLATPAAGSKPTTSAKARRRARTDIQLSVRFIRKGGSGRVRISMAPHRRRQNRPRNWVQQTPMNSKLAAIFLGAGVLVAVMAATPSGDAAEPGPI